MNESHDPVIQIGWLQQALRSNKRRIGFLLGAGCPMSIRSPRGKPLIPDIRRMTTIISRVLRRSGATAAHFATLQQQFIEDARPNPTIEDFLTRVRSLRAVAGNGEARGLGAEALDALDARMCELISTLTDKSAPSGASPYYSLAKWADGKRRGFPVEVFTTNYDLLVEQAFEEAGVPYFDGFAGVRKPFFDLRAMEEDVVPPRWARLWKLHGSINWFQDGGQRVWRGSASDTTDSRRVIHPSHHKYHESRRLPYLAMMDRLRSFLRQDGATLVVCGYSFRDEHINEVIVQGLRASSSSVAFALQFDKLADIAEACGLATEQASLNILGHDGAVVGGKRLPWITRDAENAAGSNSPWVEWSPPGPEAEAEPHVAAFRLGDFAKFGAFLAELVGMRLEGEGAANGD